MEFPTTRMRRTRQTETIRRMVRESRLSIDDLIYPMFVVHGHNVKSEIKSLPGNYHLSIDRLVEECKKIHELMIPAVLLFGLPELKDEMATEAYDPNGIIPKAIKVLKSEIPDLMVIADVCFCEYTNHGHCGILKDGYLENDLTLDLLRKSTLSYVKAGADMVAPSCMLDGMIKTMREALEEHGYHKTLIMSYAAKYASSLYNPFFRHGTQSVVAFGDKKTYQMDYANSDEAVREVAMDIAEGADIVMVKPAITYLDVVYRVKQEFGVPVAVYNVSGEYAMISCAGRQELIDADAVMMEFLTSYKRAGADLILTYFAKKVARMLNEQGVIR